MEGTTNLTAIFARWWYGEAITTIFKYSKAIYIYTADLFSVKLCIATMFDPWKRDVLSYEGQGLNEKFHTWGQNLASRIIGALVKIFTLIGYLVFTLVIVILNLLALLAWSLYPLIVVYFIYRVIS